MQLDSRLTPAWFSFGLLLQGQERYQEPAFAGRWRDANRLFAASMAARAAAGDGLDVAEGTPTERRQWCAWALEWLQVDLVLMEAHMERGSLWDEDLITTLDVWMRQCDLAGVRDRPCELPAPEQAQ